MDPWSFAIALLLGTLSVPRVRWPPERRRLIIAPPDLEPDIDLPPEEPEPAYSPLDEAIVQSLATLGAASVRELAGDVGAPWQSVWRALDG